MKYIVRLLMLAVMVVTMGSGYVVADEAESNQITSMEQFLPSANDLTKQHKPKQEFYASSAGSGDSGEEGGWFCTQYPVACWFLGSAAVIGTVLILKNQSHHDVPAGAPAGGGGGAF